MPIPNEIERRLGLLADDQREAAFEHLRALIRARSAELPPLQVEAIDLARRAGLSPDPWQERFLSSAHPRILLNCTRQAGKSTMAAALAVHRACFEPESLVLLLSPSQRQSQELFKKAAAIYRAAGSPSPAKTESALRLELENGSRIVSLPGKEETVRGFSGVDLLVVDEAARVGQDLYLSVRPMLAVSGGRLLALSTPYGTRGWWYEAWHSDETWERYEIPAIQCPRISADFLAEERRVMGEWWFAQEYECRFLDGENQPFRREDIDRTFEEQVESWKL